MKTQSGDKWIWAYVAVLIMSVASVIPQPAQAQWTDAAEACYQAGDDPASGISLCTVAIESGVLSDEFLAITYSNRGNSYFDLSRYDQAVVDYDMALELEPGDAVTLSNRGAAFLELEDYDQALEDLNMALEIYPANAVALTNRCWIHAIEERFELAQYDCDDALGLEPMDPIALASRAYVLMQQGDIEAAREDAELAVQFGGHLWQTHFYRGLSYEMDGDLTAAEASYRVAVDLAPGEPRVRDKLAELGVH